MGLQCLLGIEEPLGKGKRKTSKTSAFSKGLSGEMILNAQAKTVNDFGSSAVCSVKHHTGGRLYQDSHFGWVTEQQCMCVTKKCQRLLQTHVPSPMSF